MNSRKQIPSGDDFNTLRAFFEDVAQTPYLNGREEILPLTRRIRRGMVLRKLVSNNPEKTFVRIVAKLRDSVEEFDQQARSRHKPSLDIGSLGNEIQSFLDDPHQTVPLALRSSIGVRENFQDIENEKYVDLGWRCFYLLSLLPAHLRTQPNQAYQDSVREQFRLIYREGKTSRTQLVEGTLRYAIVIARLYIGRGIPFLDLVQEGTLGISAASERYNEQRGIHFQAYATMWIRQKIERYISVHARLIRIPVHQMETVHKIDRYVEEFLDRHGKRPSDTEIFLKMGWIDSNDLRLIEPALVAQRLKHLELKRKEYDTLLTVAEDTEASIKSSRQEKIAVLHKKREELTKQFGREPHNMELYCALGWFTEHECTLLQLPPIATDSKRLASTLSKLRKSKEQMRRYHLATAEHLCPQDVEIRSTPNGLIQPLDQLIPDSSFDLSESSENSSLADLIDKLLAQLDERERHVLQQRFGLIDGEDQTLEEIGQKMYVTRERVRQIEAKALRKLNGPSRRHALKDYFDNHGEALTSANDQIMMKFLRALDADAEMHYEDHPEIRAEKQMVEKYINQYVTRGRTRVIDTRRQVNRVELFRQILEQASEPLHYSSVHDRAVELVPEALRFNKKQSYATLFYRADVFRPMGGAVFGLTLWDTRLSDSNGHTVLPHCPRPLLRLEDPRSFFEFVMFGRDLLMQRPMLTATQFYAEQLATIGNGDGAGQDIQSAFDAWYASGLVEYVHFARDSQHPMMVTMPTAIQLQEARTYCLNNLCTRILRMPELLLVLDSIAHPTIIEIQKVLFGSEKAGFDVINRLLLFQAFGAVRRDRDEWRLAQPGYAALDANPPQELPDFGEIITENQDDRNVIDNWDDDLILVDI